MTEQIKPKKKKISHTARIKKYKILIQDLEKSNDSLWESNHKLRTELNELRKLLPLKYYRIKFKIKANSGNIFEYQEFHQAYNITNLIEKTKFKKTYPDSLELLDITLLGE